MVVTCPVVVKITLNLSTNGTQFNKKMKSQETYFKNEVVWRNGYIVKVFLLGEWNGKVYLKNGVKPGGMKGTMGRSRGRRHEERVGDV